MKGRRAKRDEEALKPKTKGKGSSGGKISRAKKGRGRGRKEQEAVAAMEREGPSLENTSELIDIGDTVVPGVDGAMDDLRNGWWDEEGPWWTNVVDDQEVSWGWGSAWLPFWDVEFTAEASELLFDDIGWEDSLWNFDVEPEKTHPQ